MGMGERTRRNLEEAFLGEAKAHFRLKAFAKKADDDGYHAVARLFRAVAEAEGVHAANHFARLNRVGETQDNLKASFEKETFVNEVAYPRLLKEAWAEEEKDAVWTLTKARNVEERHARLYRTALSRMTVETLPVYFVCGICGWIAEGGAPVSCPNCEGPGEEFRRVD
jgi:rubrerythrin